jgi:uncharacterized membrane protein
MKTLLLASALTLFTVAPAFSQTRSATASDDQTAAQNDNGRHHSYGWIGLIGLIGLAGLRSHRAEETSRNYTASTPARTT